MTDAAYLDRLETTLADLAEIMENAAAREKYWPIFDRLDAERQSVEARSDRLSAARRRVSPARQGQRAA